VIPIRIEPLTRSHERKQFDCGEPSLNRYIQQLAIQNDERNIGRTFVAVLVGSQKVIGYYTLASGRVSFQHLPDVKRLPPNMPMPVILLGRLAVDNSSKGLRLGEFLLMHALWRCSEINRDVAVHAVEVDAIDEGARAFYERYGFVSLLDNPRHMYLPMKQIVDLGFTFQPDS
jgi:predicted GNAT family N-acyltransferase